MPLYKLLPKEPSCQTQTEQKQKETKQLPLVSQDPVCPHLEQCFAGWKKRKMTLQSISLQGDQRVCEQTSTSHDRAQSTFIYSVALVQP